jgi:hypothetical protein
VVKVGFASLLPAGVFNTSPTHHCSSIMLKVIGPEAGEDRRSSTDHQAIHLAERDRHLPGPARFTGTVPLHPLREHLPESLSGMAFFSVSGYGRKR